jgi:DNA polymerase-3 subunit chi
MTRIDFYLLPDNPDGDRRAAACKLIHKAFRLGHRIYVLTDTPDEALSLDNLLWTFSPGSFIPHALAKDNRHAATPVLLGSDEPPGDFHDVLISLAATVPGYFSRFERVAEIVGASAQEKEGARERFRFYRDRGYPLNTHTL